MFVYYRGMSDLKSQWKIFTVCLTRACENVENKFTEIVGEHASKVIGDFFLLSFCVTKQNQRRSQNNRLLNQSKGYRLVDQADRDEFGLCHAENEDL